jgi:hypothetical protein
MPCLPASLFASSAHPFKGHAPRCVFFCEKRNELDMITNIAVLDLTMCCKGRYWGSDGAVNEDSGFPGCHVMSNDKQYRRFGRAKCFESVSNYSTYVPVDRAWYLRTLHQHPYWNLKSLVTGSSLYTSNCCVVKRICSHAVRGTSSPCVLSRSD